ncbi:MAG: translation initiation factor IF-2 [Myxococcaceae bacterium]|nr:translation initiation factor IF-2 [Myxococcaceae bacterium]MBH2006410.1 translation initiation factor IF-2 [Myxococcaceae bacterium]
MAKVRIHELAKRFGLSNQELLNKLASKGIAVKSHSSNIEEEQVIQALQTTNEISAKPRTVLRRRKDEVEEPVFDVSPPAPFVSELPIKTIEPVQVADSSQPKPEIPLKPSATPLVSPTQPSASAAAITPPLAQNVVRVIDPNAIRARLASENRTFKPRVPPQSRPPFSPVREIRIGVGPGTPAAPGQADNRLGSKGALKKRKEDSFQTNQDRKELRSGGYELWTQPGKKRRNVRKVGKSTHITQAAAHKRVIELTGPISVNDLAHRMSMKAGQVVAKLMSMGMMVTINQPIDPDTVSIIANEFDFEVKNIGFVEDDLLKETEDTQESLVTRPPVVTVMGHVDHGKTSILDALRKANVAEGEAGGITQHIGAYSVETERGPVTFLDTPGHEAFTAMRARGAQVTDIVILVVAADDGIMPQTIEAIDHAKAAKVPLVVAINKMDSAAAKPERILQQLSEHGIVPEEWGGETQVFRVSALKKTGLNDLLEGLINQAEIMELKANANKQAVGCVIEARLDKGRGPVATVLTQAGTLKQGDYIVAGQHSGRVRAMYDSNGHRVEKSTPSMAVQVLGLSGIPTAGDKFNAVADDKAAKTIADHRAIQIREQELLKSSRVTLESFLQSSPSEKSATLRLIVKADAYGSVEALNASLRGLSTKLVAVEVVHSGVGTITENDVNLALASKTIIIGFNTKPDSKAHTLATQEKVDIRSYSIIYNMLDEVKLAMAGLLAPVFEEIYLGRAEVRAIFSVNKLGNIAGCYVLDGKMLRTGQVRVKRGNKFLHQGKIGSFKRFKDDVREVGVGYEFGLGLEGFDDLAIGDSVECFELKQVAAKLDAPLKAETTPSGGGA